MKTFGIALIIAVIAILFPSCKYEDGPLISLRSKESRIVGRKRIVRYEVDGKDSIPYILAAFANTSYDSTGFEWLGEIELSQIGCTFGCVSGFWMFQNNKDDLYMRLPAPVLAPEVFPNGDWQIMRLTAKDLWLELEENGKHYLLMLEELPERF